VSGPGYLLVDGYNIIFAWEELARLTADSLAAARLRLCDILCDYQGMSGLCVIVVFDAHNVEDNPGSVSAYHNITVVFTKEAETADHYIERASRELSARGAVTVATSDRLEQIIILSQGARRVSAADLMTEIAYAREEMRARYLSDRPVKNNPLAGLLDADTARKLDALRYDAPRYEPRDTMPRDTTPRDTNRALDSGGTLC
jgi:predicted RNA-binding protein with PIN domain